MAKNIFPNITFSFCDSAPTAALRKVTSLQSSSLSFFCIATASKSFSLSSRSSLVRKEQSFLYITDFLISNSPHQHSLHFQSTGCKVKRQTIGCSVVNIYPSSHVIPNQFLEYFLWSEQWLFLEKLYPLSWFWFSCFFCSFMAAVLSLCTFSITFYVQSINTHCLSAWMTAEVLS